MADGNGQVPLLGQKKLRGSIQTVGVLIHHLDEAGTYEPQAVVAMPDGTPVAVAARSDLVTATDLVEMIRLMVREEIHVALGRDSRIAELVANQWYDQDGKNLPLPAAAKDLTTTPEAA